MTLRTFEDSSGERWTVWDTVRSSDTPVTAAFVDGWLTFDSAAEKRRLAPIPGGWVAATDQQLERLLARAEPVVRGRADRLLARSSGGSRRTSSARAASASSQAAPTPATGATATAEGGPPHGATLRTFTDATGLAWSVWAVRPGAAPNGEDAPERRGDAAVAGAGQGRLPYGERRLQVRSEYARGWLAFHASSGARRRLMPIPERWQTLPDEELERCCRSARPMPDVER